MKLLQVLKVMTSGSPISTEQDWFALCESMLDCRCIALGMGISCESCPLNIAADLIIEVADASH